MSMLIHIEISNYAIGFESDTFSITPRYSEDHIAWLGFYLQRFNA